jgi:aryl-alcohol dehydrogenase-like predicted oxidoreductase
VRGAACASLERLGIDRIGLHQVHGMDRWVAESVRMDGMDDLLVSGEIRHIGASNYNLGRRREAKAAIGRPVVTDQVRYSLATRQPASDLLFHALTNDGLIIASSPLDQGLLTGKYSRGTAPRFRRPSTEYFSSKNLRRAVLVARGLREVAAAYGASSAQVALAWLVPHPNVVGIPCAKSLSQLKENAAADLVLADEEVARPTAAADGFHPARHPREQARRAAMRARGCIRQLVGGADGVTAVRWRRRS